MVDYDRVSEREWVYAPQEWIYVVYLSVLFFVWLRDRAGSAYDDYWMVCWLWDVYDASANRSG